jgi:hypothetical protein
METIILNVDSKYRDKTLFPLTTCFRHKLDFPIKNVIEISLTSIRIPNTSYKISNAKGNNLIRFNDNILAVDDGNYTLIELLELINYHNSLTQVINIQMSIEDNTNKIVVNGDCSFNMYFPKVSDYPSLGEILGFNNVEYLGFNYYRGERAVNFIDNYYYLLKLNDLGKVYNSNFKYFAKILARVPKDNVDYESNYEFVTKTTLFDQPIDIEFFNIELFDYLNNIVDLNGLDIDLTLEIKTITNTLLKKYKELNFYDEELMKLVLNDQMLKFYVEANKQIDLFNTYDKVLQSEVIFNPRVNLEPNEQYLTNHIDKKIEEISKNYDKSVNEELKKIEYDDIKKREERKKKKMDKKLKLEGLTNKFKY